MVEFYRGTHAILVTTTNDVIKLFMDRQQNFTKADFKTERHHSLIDNHISEDTD
jgi:hypothetical protein